MASTEQKLVKDYLTAQKIDTTFLSTSAAEAKFLKITTAAAEYLKITAAKNEFIQGRGGVVSAATRALADGSVTQLLKSPDGGLVVSLKTDRERHLGKHRQHHGSAHTGGADHG